MPNDKLDKFKSVLELLQKDTVRPQEIEQFLSMVINVIKQTNDSFKTLSAENLQEIKNTLSYLQVEHAQALKEIDAKNKTVAGDFEQKIKEVQSLINEIKALELKDGEDGKDADETVIVAEVLKLIPPVKEVVLDDGEKIVAKINDLPTDNDDLKIDADHIKNLPKEVQKHSFAVQRNLAWFDETTLIIENPTKIKFQGSGVQASVDSEGSVIVTVNGGSGSATFVDEAMIDSGDHTTFTISSTPTAGTLLVINENTGQAVPTSAYSNTTTSVVFGSSQQVDDGAGNLVTPTFRARYSH